MIEHLRAALKAAQETKNILAIQKITELLRLVNPAALQNVSATTKRDFTIYTPTKKKTHQTSTKRGLPAVLEPVVIEEKVTQPSTELLELEQVGAMLAGLKGLTNKQIKDKFKGMEGVRAKLTEGFGVVIPEGLNDSNVLKLFKSTVKDLIATNENEKAGL